MTLPLKANQDAPAGSASMTPSEQVLFDDLRPDARFGCQARRRELPAGHAVDRVVHEDHGDREPHVRGVEDLREADRREVAVALVAHDDRVRVRELVADRDRGRAAVRRLEHVDVEVLVGEHRASHRRDADGAVEQAEFIEHLGRQAMDDAMRAAGAVVRRRVSEAVGPVVYKVVGSLDHHESSLMRGHHALEPGLAWVNIEAELAARHALDLAQELARERHDAAEATVEFDRDAALDGESNILQHLPGVHLGDQEAAHVTRKLFNNLEWEWADGDRPEQANPDSLLPRGAHC